MTNTTPIQDKEKCVSKNNQTTQKSGVSCNQPTNIISPIKEGWMKYKTKVAINDYGNAVVKITMEFIRGEIDINTRDKKWLNEAIKLSEQIETLLQRKERETREDIAKKIEKLPQVSWETLCHGGICKEEVLKIVLDNINKLK